MLASASSRIALETFGFPPFDSAISAALRRHLAHAAGGALIVPMAAF
jgi:hypothetical protein